MSVWRAAHDLCAVMVAFGHHTFAIAMDSENTSDAPDISDAVKSILSKANVESAGDLLHGIIDSNLAVTPYIQQIIRAEQCPTVIIASSRKLAYLLHEALGDNGFSVPHDIGLTYLCDTDDDEAASLRMENNNLITGAFFSSRPESRKIAPITIFMGDTLLDRTQMNAPRCVLSSK